MNSVLFISFLIANLVFFYFGYHYKTRIYVILGSLFMILLGFIIITNGIYIPMRVVS
jgi:hypothetical protein